MMCGIFVFNSSYMTNVTFELRKDISEIPYISNKCWVSNKGFPLISTSATTFRPEQAPIFKKRLSLIRAVPQNAVLIRNQTIK